MFETGARLKAEHGAENVFDFSLGNPNAPPPLEFARTLARLASESVHGYTPNGGIPAVRAQVAGFVAKEQGVSLTGDHLIMTCGAGGALNVALKSIINPGDTVVASTPCFMEYSFYADNHGGKLELVKSRDDFDLDVDAIESQLREDTAAVIINSPNNPTGRVYGEQTLSSLGQMLSRKSRELGRAIYLISDEPYRKIVFDGVSVPSVFSAYKNTIVASSYSKDLSIPGERIGWLAVHPDAESVAELVDAFVLCNRVLGYVNAPALMQRVVAELQGVGVDPSIYQNKRDKLCGYLSEIGYTVTPPDGALYAFPKAPGDDDLAAVDALRDELILAVPGRGFGMPGYFRLAFCTDDGTIERAEPAFRRAFEKLTSVS